MPDRRKARIKAPLTREFIRALKPKQAPYIAWDARQAGYGVKVHPSGVKSHLVAYRANGGGRHATQRCAVIARTDAMPPTEARRRARAILGEASAGGDPHGARAHARSVTVQDAFDGFLASNPNRAPSTDSAYRSLFRRTLRPMAKRPLADLTRTDVERMFNAATADHGASTANKLIAILGAMCRRANAELPDIGNPVEAWRMGGGRRNPARRRQAPAPADALPAWRAGIVASVTNPVHLALLMFLLHTGARRGEASNMRWRDIDRRAGTLSMPRTKNGLPLTLPITVRMNVVIEAMANGRRHPPPSHCVFPSPRSPQRPVGGLQALHGPISHAGGQRFWTHAMRNAFIAVAIRDLGLPVPMVKRLVNHAAPRDVTEGYASDWTISQLKDSMERIGARMDALMGAGGGALGWDSTEIGQ